MTTCQLCEPEEAMHENPCECLCHIRKDDDKQIHTTQWTITNATLEQILDEESNE